MTPTWRAYKTMKRQKTMNYKRRTEASFTELSTWYYPRRTVFRKSIYLFTNKNLFRQ